MTDTNFLPLPPTQATAAGRKLRSASGSPTRQRPADSLLAPLHPSTAVHAIQNPIGPLKICMDASTVAEQTFAHKVARASYDVEKWLLEVSAWPWPSDNGSLGYEMPWEQVERTITSQAAADSSPNGSEQGEESWMGSLPAADVAAYDQRLDAIQKDLDGLRIEELKRHVLHHHIQPLSRPSTPVKGAVQPAAPSLLGVTRMRDLTAVITSIVLQMLPNLSRLTLLMDAWKIRIVVLMRVPRMLGSLRDAEVALSSGWQMAQTLASLKPDQSFGSSSVTGHDFQIMKSAIKEKVSQTGHLIDYMLDSLDGQEDTIPDEWIDRMDKIESEYSRWVTACEQSLRDAAWTKSKGKMGLAPPIVLTPSRQGSRERNDDTRSKEDGLKVQPPANISHEPVYDKRGRARTRSQPFLLESLAADPPVMIQVHPADGSSAGPEDYATESQLSSPGEDVHGAQLKSYDGPGDSSSAASHWTRPPGETGYSSPAVSDTRLSLSSQSSQASLRSEPSLPSMRDVHRRMSDASAASYAPSGLDVESDSPRFDDSPRMSPMQDPDTTQGEGLSPPGSPPNFRSSVRSTVTFDEMPTVTELPEYDSSPKTPLDQSSFFDESMLSRDFEPTNRAKTANEDDQLQQQISHILESIPAKIHLSSQPAAISHLNPPDFEMPRPKPRLRDTNRSQSSLSSRSGTPSFLLAPAYAKHSKPRPQKANQDIKLYHLSRSTGEPPIKLFIRVVGDSGERVMVRVGGGWADLGEYLKEYASHHGRRSKKGEGDNKIEIRDLPAFNSSKLGSSPPSRPSSGVGTPMTPLHVRKTRRSVGEESAPRRPKTPLATSVTADTPPSNFSTHSRSSSRLSWVEEDSSLGMSGPKTKQVEMSDESRAWVESVKEKVRAVSGEQRKVTDSKSGKFGEIDKVGGTKRLFRKN